jgi:hypothetical protein
MFQINFQLFLHRYIKFESHTCTHKIQRVNSFLETTEASCYCWCGRKFHVFWSTYFHNVYSHPWMDLWSRRTHYQKYNIKHLFFMFSLVEVCGWMDFRPISNANLYFLIQSTFIYDIFHILRHPNLLYPFWIIIEFNVRCGFFGTSPNNFHFLMCRWKSTDTWLLFVLTLFAGVGVLLVAVLALCLLFVVDL